MNTTMPHKQFGLTMCLFSNHKHQKNSVIRVVLLIESIAISIFHDRREHGRSIRMNDSNQPANGSPVIDCGYVQTAHRRVEEMRTSNPHSLEPPTVLELEEALGQRVQKCELLGKNWRNRVYRLELGSGATAVAKQVIMGTDATVQYQYDQLQALAKLQIPGLRIPKPLGLFHAKRTFVMEFARGKTIGTLV